MSGERRWWVLLAFLVYPILQVTGKGDSYTAEELQLLPKLLDRVKEKLTKDYMFQDKFLVRYLRARSGDLDRAEEMILDTLNWRKEQRMDIVLSEDVTSWKQKFPYYLPLDKEGRPGIASATGLSTLDFRKVILSGKADEIRRYVYYVIESGLENLPRVSNLTGTEFISGNLIVNLAGYNNRNHACVACLPYWIEMAQGYERYYPYLASRVIGVNAPRLFEVLLNIVRPFLTLTTQKAVNLYGFNKAVWQNEIFKIFPRSELTQEFGGTRKLPKI